MKRVFVLFLFLFLSVSPVQAMVFFPEVTNWSDSTENSPGLGFFPLHYGNSSVESISNGYYAWGTAFEFNLDQDMLIKSIKSPIAVSRGIQNRIPVPGVWTMNLTLYSGSTNIFRGEILPNGQVIPITRDPVLSQNFTAYGHDLLPIGSPQGRVYTYQGLDNLSLNLPSGKYWATYFDGSVVTYVKSQVRLEGCPTAPVPEPATLFLLGGGLVGAILRRRKVAKV